MKQTNLRYIEWSATFLILAGLILVQRMQGFPIGGSPRIALILIGVTVVWVGIGLYPTLFVLISFALSLFRLSDPYSLFRMSKVLFFGMTMIIVLEGLKRRFRLDSGFNPVEPSPPTPAEPELDHFRSIVEQTPVAISLEDASGRLLLTNSSFAALHGLEFEAIQGKTRKELKLEQDGGWLDTDASTIRTINGAVECEKRFRGKETDLTLHSLTFEVKREAQTYPDVCTFHTDIRASRIAETSLRLISRAGELLGEAFDLEVSLTHVANLFVNTLADCCMIDLIDDQDTVRRIAAAKSFSVGDSVLTQLNLRYPAGRNQTAFAEQVLYEGFPLKRSEHDLGLTSLWILPLKARHRINGLIWIASTRNDHVKEYWTPALIDELSRRTALAIDNARLHRDARESYRKVDEAYREVAKVNEELKAALAVSEEAVRVKTHFLAVLSHELRTPLTPVTVSLSALIADPETPAEIREILEVAQRNVQLEARLIDDLLDLTQISQGKLRLDVRPVDAHDLIHHAINICRTDIDSSGHKLELDLSATDHFILADPDRFLQVIWNLIKNATKYTNRAGVISVNTWNKQGAMLIEVGDTGIGIAPEALDRIFEPFTQSQNAYRRMSKGLGLGLTISRSLAQALGGSLTASSAGVGRGSEFRLSLPAIVPPSQGAGIGKRQDETILEGEGWKILLVEDNNDTRMVMKKLLTQRGYQVTAVDTIKGAIEAVDEEKFDLLVSDIGLPDGDGLELMRHISRVRPMKAIALSGYGMDADLDESYAAGFAVHLTKPIDFTKLAATIRRMLTEPDAETVARVNHEPSATAATEPANSSPGI